LPCEWNQLYNSAINVIEQQSKDKNIALFRDTESITFAPIRDNKVLDEEQFNQLPQAERDVFHVYWADTGLSIVVF
jgi:hypothetical protein